MKKLIVFAIAIFGFTAISFGQNPSTATANATATVLIPISIANNTDLAFGTFAQSAGTVTIATTGTRTSSGVNLYTISGVTPAAASFTVTGDANSSFSIVLPANGTVSLSGPTGTGTKTMAVTSFQSNPAAGTTALVAGTKAISVGATITVAADQAVGSYTATFPVVVNYN